MQLKKELDDYLTMMEEAERRDHRKLGKQLNLFFLDEHGPGFPFFMPKGVEILTNFKKCGELSIKKEVIRK